MTIQKGDKKALLKCLRSLKIERDIEKAHSEAERALLEYIGDEEITKAYEDLDKWYA